MTLDDIDPAPALDYATLLRDPRWQRRRLEIFSRDGWACVACGAADRPLQVHHLRYDASRFPWEYPESWLRTLCEPCHGRRHILQPRAMETPEAPAVAGIAVSWCAQDGFKAFEPIPWTGRVIDRSERGRLFVCFDRHWRDTLIGDCEARAFLNPRPTPSWIASVVLATREGVVVP